MYNTYSMEDLKRKKNLGPQDVVKCCLRLYQEENDVSYYDCRKHLWQMRPGDVIFVKGSFRVLMSYPRIDDTLSHVICGHMEEELEISRRKRKAPREMKCGCRKWYIYYKMDDGKVKKFYPPYDGMTVISSAEIQKVITEVHDNDDVKGYFEEGVLGEEMVMKVMKDIRSKKKCYVGKKDGKKGRSA